MDIFLSCLQKRHHIAVQHICFNVPACFTLTSVGWNNVPQSHDVTPGKRFSPHKVIFFSIMLSAKLG